MRVLSLTQPWATLVACGAKKIETRSWQPPKALIGQRIGIHASKGLADMTQRDFNDLCMRPVFRAALVAGWKAGLIKSAKEHLYPWDLPRGMILATARITGCWSTNDEALVDRLPDAERAFGNYAYDRYMWALDEVHALAEPIAAKGALGLWTWQPPEGWEVAA
jgi:hypothetical protein